MEAANNNYNYTATNGTHKGYGVINLTIAGHAVSDQNAAGYIQVDFDGGDNANNNTAKGLVKGISLNGQYDVIATVKASDGTVVILDTTTDEITEGP